MLESARSHLGDEYRGDLDAPRVEIVSEPSLGASMGLPDSDAEVWRALETTARALTARCDVYAIACNTLNIYAERLRALDLGAELVSFPDAVARWAQREGVGSFGLVGSRSVASLGEWSPYAALTGDIRVEPPPDPEQLHQLIEQVKLDGGADPGHGDRLAALIEQFESATLVLACTELPLVARAVAGRTLVDVTKLVADQLVRRWMAMRPD